MAEFSLKDSVNIRNNLTKAQEDEISMLYRGVYLKTRTQMLSIPKDGTTSQQIQRQYLNKLHVQLDDAYKSLGIGLEKKIAKDAKKSAQGVVDDAKKFTGKIGLKIEGAYSRVPTDVVESLVTGQVYAGNWTLSGAIWSEIDKHQSDISKIIAEGAAANKSAYEIAKDLEMYVDPSAKKPWDWSKVYPGTSKKVDYNAQRLARTMISHAYQQSLERVCKNNPFVTGYIWVSSGDERMCELCDERNGKHFDKGDLPMDHPNGRCTFEADIPDSPEQIADRLADWAKGADDPEMDGYIASIYGLEVKAGFSPEQEKILGAMGYSPENMPKDFQEFYTKLPIPQMDEVIKLAGTSWSSKTMYADLEKYYLQNLATVKPYYSLPVPSTADIIASHIQSAAPALDKWIDTIKGQTEKHMLELENTTLANIGSQGKAAIGTYTGSSYKRINKYLMERSYGYSKAEALMRSGADEYHIDTINGMKKAFGSTQLGENLVLRRGSSIGDLANMLPGDNYEEKKAMLQGMSIAELNDMFQGNQYALPRYTSTSSLWERGFNGELETVYYAPKETKGSSIMQFSRFGTTEGETLLDSDTKVRVLKIEQSDGHMDSSIRAYMEIVP